jgi:hypothetical protein
MSFCLILFHQCFAYTNVVTGECDSEELKERNGEFLALRLQCVPLLIDTREKTLPHFIVVVVVKQSGKGLQPCCGLFDSGATTVSQAYRLDFRGKACLVDIRDHMMSNAGVCFPPLLLLLYRHPSLGHLYCGCEGMEVMENIY